MEDGNRLDLTLSLPCGGPSAATKGKTATSSDVRVEEADRGSKLIDDFKNFLDGSNHKEEVAMIPQRVNQSKPEENIFYDLSKGPANVEGGNKRKNMFDEINNQKRHERDRDAYRSSLHIKPPSRTPHASITADDGSTAENEDVASSEADDVSKGSKEVRVSESTGVDLKSQSQRGFTISSEKDFKLGHVVSHGVPYSGQSANVVNLPYSFSVKESNSVQGGQQPVIPANLPLMFGYSTVQAATVSAAAVPVNTSKPFERAKGDGKKAKEEGSSMHAEPDTKGMNTIDQSKPEAFPLEHPAIRPGIAAELKFGGSGSSPNLPWVSTTGPGPNGKTISGVTYRYSGTQIRIVCACHGSHMSPEEFVQHASEEQPNLNGGPAGLPSFSNGNPAASAQN
ncbi:putative Ninja family, Jas TPL-binding domain-containing protein [Helianthus annuus]|nr:putative Ninja family, Jas TPL-binding domain-containing protein [Helianthus annuus]